jgi:hypothetical protein
MVASVLSLLFLTCVERPKVVFFALRDCPISRKYIPEINAIGRDYKERAEFEMILVEPEISSAEASKFAKSYKISFPVKIDRDLKLSKAANVKIVPTVALLMSGKLKYVGRIDDRFPALGSQRAPRRKDLRVALDQVLAGKPVTTPRTEAVGCILTQP